MSSSTTTMDWYGADLDPLLGWSMFEEVAGQAEAGLQIARQLRLRGGCCKGSSNTACMHFHS